jgi:hypothetical protein
MIRRIKTDPGMPSCETLSELDEYLKSRGNELATRNMARKLWMLFVGERGVDHRP